MGNGLNEKSKYEISFDIKIDLRLVWHVPAVETTSLQTTSQQAICKDSSNRMFSPLEPSHQLRRRKRRRRMKRKREKRRKKKRRRGKNVKSQIMKKKKVIHCVHK